MAFYDTAGSVKITARARPADAAAAIASDMAAKLYGASILKRNIEDNRHNFTRFFLLTKQDSHAKNRTGNSKTSIVFSIAKHSWLAFSGHGLLRHARSEPD